MTALASAQTPNASCLSLADYLARVPDTRHDQGKRHPLAAVLNLVAAAVLCGMRSLQAIAQLGRTLTRHEAERLGFTHPITPCKSTLSEVLRHVGLDDLEQQLRAWAQTQSVDDEHLALDGKTLRGTADDDVPAVHLLALYAVASGVTLAQTPVGDKTNEHKAALEFLHQVPLAGKVVTADAMFTHRDFCSVIGEGGGDYVLPAKDNQPNLLRDIQAIFTPEAGLSPPPATLAGGRSTAGLGSEQGTRPPRATNGEDNDAVERLPGLAGG
jgi:DDE_Tnp_1-associated/Transposase DDE domain